MTKLTQELAVARARGRPLSVALNGRLKSKGETLCGKSEDGKSPSEQDWGKTSQVHLGFIYCLGVYTCVH